MPVKSLGPRNARPSDMTFICECASRFRLHDENLKPEQFLVAEVDRKIVGFGRTRPYGTFCELGCLGVAERYRSQGIADEILKELIRRFPDQDVWVTTDIPAYCEWFGFERADDAPDLLKVKIRHLRPWVSGDTRRSGMARWRCPSSLCAARPWWQSVSPVIRSMSSLSLRASLRIAFASLLVLAAHGCRNPTAPSSDALVLFSVGEEMFQVRSIEQDHVRAAVVAQAGVGPPIPKRRAVAGNGVNLSWSWHLEDVEFTEVAEEICDGGPLDVEREGLAFGGGWCCPWAARMVFITPGWRR